MAYQNFNSSPLSYLQLLQQMNQQNNPYPLYQQGDPRANPGFIPGQQPQAQQQPQQQPQPQPQPQPPQQAQSLLSPFQQRRDERQARRADRRQARQANRGMLPQPGAVQQQAQAQQQPQAQTAPGASKANKAALIMGALSDVFGGRDPTTNMINRQTQMVAMQEAADQKRRYEQAYAAAPPAMQKVMANYSPADWTAVQGQLDLYNLKQTGAYAGTSMDAQYMNDLELGKDDIEYQKTSRYKVAYQEMHKPETYLNQAGQPVTRPGLRPGTYPNPFGEDESGTGDVVGISQAERNTLIKSNQAVDDATDRIKVLAQSIKDIDPNPLTFGVARAEIDSKYTQLQLELKNLFALGVLAGADLDLLEAVTGNPTDWKQFLIRGGQEGSLIQLQSLLEIANINKNRNLLRLGETTVSVPVLFGDENKETKRVQLTLD